MRRLIAFLVALSAVLCLCAGCGGQEAQPKDPGPADFKGLVLKAASDVTVSLYSEFDEGAPISPTHTFEGEEEDYYYYSGLFGAYRCKANGSGYYTITKNITMTEEKNQTKTVIDVTPGKMAGDGWEPAALSIYTDELLTGGFSDDLSQWPEYEAVFASPYFTQDHGDHQITTQTQMEEYLKSLDSADDRMYLYSAGTSKLYRHDIPIAVFTTTDLSGASDLEQAAKLMGQDKPTVLYRAQMHGNEPAGGEAALAMIKWLDEDLGNDLLDKLNICVIPRQNPDGAHNYERTVMGGIDPNRDSLRLETPEITAYMQLCQWLEPEIIIDGHEYNAQVVNKNLADGDILVGLGYTNDNTMTFRDISLEVSHLIFDAVAENGLGYRYYSNYVNSANASISRAYASQQGTLFFLLETRGIGCGLAAYPRRIATHIISTETILRFAAENADRIQSTVDAERQNIITNGAIYDMGDTILLDTSAVEDITLRHPSKKFEQLTGLATDNILTPKVYSAVTRSRVAPTAYVIPAGESFTETVLKLMDKHGIEYTFIPEGSTVKLQQYSSAEADLLTNEKSVTFPKGAYVFCKNQVRGITLSMLMEPDVDDVAEQSSTLVQQGILRATNGLFPLYRYIHNLNAAGFIDYQ